MINLKFQTEGIVIKEQSVGEYDRLVTVLTKEYGLLHAFVRGAKNLKSKLTSSTQLFSYSKLSFYRGKDAYIIDEASPIEVFFNLRKSIEKLSLAQYFCELTSELAPVEECADEYVRLLLNSLYLLVESKRTMSMIKAVNELRLLSISGYLPDLIGCNSCGAYDSEFFSFQPDKGIIICSECCIINSSGIKISSSILAAMRFICYSSVDKIFSFKLSSESMDFLSEVTEIYVKEQLQKNFKTLDFYKAMRGQI